MTSVSFYFQVHQPFRLRKFNVFDIGNNSNYFDDTNNQQIMDKVASKCYLPTNRMLLELIDQCKDKFRISFSITGTALEQFEQFRPDVLDSFKELVDTGCVEMLSETYYHSLAWLKSKKEFESQINLHKKKIKSLFGLTPKVFRNTELIFNNEIAHDVENMGYKVILAEGADHILDWRSPNFVYKPKTTNNMKLLLKNYKLSDDIAFRFGDRSWKEWPLTTEKFSQWVSSSHGDVINLFMDYETFGEHQWDDTGIFNFMRHLPQKLLKNPYINFKTPSEVAASFDAKEELDIHHTISWADMERDISAWQGNKMQQAALHNLYEVGNLVLDSKNKELIKDWRMLTTSDHFYYMCTKWFSDGDVHKYFNPYDTPYDSFIYFMNILNDIRIRLEKKEVVRSE